MQMNLWQLTGLCACMYVRVSMSACVRACVRACVCVFVCVCCLWCVCVYCVCSVIFKITQLNNLVARNDRMSYFCDRLTSIGVH